MQASARRRMLIERARNTGMFSSSASRRTIDVDLEELEKDIMGDTEHMQDSDGDESTTLPASSSLASRRTTTNRDDADAGRRAARSDYLKALQSIRAQPQQQAQLLLRLSRPSSARSELSRGASDALSVSTGQTRFHNSQSSHVSNTQVRLRKKRSRDQGLDYLSPGDAGGTSVVAVAVPTAETFIRPQLPRFPSFLADRANQKAANAAESRSLRSPSPRPGGAHGALGGSSR